MCSPLQSYILKRKIDRTFNFVFQKILYNLFMTSFSYKYNRSIFKDLLKLFVLKFYLFLLKHLEADVRVLALVFDVAFVLQIKILRPSFEFNESFLFTLFDDAFCNLLFSISKQGFCSDAENGFLVLHPMIGSVMWRRLYDNACHIKSFNIVDCTHVTFRENLFAFGIFGQGDPRKENMFINLWLGGDLLKQFSESMLNIYLFLLSYIRTCWNNIDV